MLEKLVIKIHILKKIARNDLIRLQRIAWELPWFKNYTQRRRGSSWVICRLKKKTEFLGLKQINWKWYSPFLLSALQFQKLCEARYDFADDARSCVDSSNQPMQPLGWFCEVTYDYAKLLSPKGKFSNRRLLFSFYEVRIMPITHEYIIYLQDF